MQKKSNLIAYDFFPHLFYQGGFDITKIASLQKNDIERGNYQVFPKSTQMTF